MIGGEEHSRFKQVLERAVPEIRATGKWTRVEARVRRLRRRRRFVQAGGALLAVAVVVMAGIWVRAEITGRAQQLVIADPPGVETGGSLTTTTAASVAAFRPGIDYTFGGLWAGNVETVPAHPESLPDEFFQDPGEAVFEGPDGAFPALKAKPVWILANELTSEQVVEAVRAVTDPWRTIVVNRPPVELEGVIDLQGLFHLADIATVPSIFTVEPFLVREKTFEEVSPFWRIQWADTRDPAYGAGEVAQQRLTYLSFASFTLGGYFIEENFLRAHPEIAAQREEARRTSTTVDSRYPEEREVSSVEAQTLAERVADYLLAQSGRRFAVAHASDSELVGPGEKVLMVFRDVSLALEGAGDAKVRFSLFHSDEEQLGPGGSLGPAHHFDAGPGSRGVLLMTPGRNSYQAILQLADGTTVNATSGGLHTTSADVPAPLEPEELIELVKWLATSAEPPAVPAG